MNHSCIQLTVKSQNLKKMFHFFIIFQPLKKPKRKLRQPPFHPLLHKSYLKAAESKTHVFYLPHQQKGLKAPRRNQKICSPAFASPVSHVLNTIMRHANEKQQSLVTAMPPAHNSPLIRPHWSCQMWARPKPACRGLLWLFSEVWGWSRPTWTFCCGVCCPENLSKLRGPVAAGWLNMLLQSFISDRARQEEF